MPKKKLFDPKCFELAKAFAADLDGVTLDQIGDLAHTIQVAIEDWIDTSYSDPARNQVDVQ